eukprot:GHVP01060100.1.p1 GENE.GHVP01060100.1~~GHVP01060100.1.p1  ORF type:complete len:1484 (+),score=238.40 GHVP01060100.1:42-4493(+)
MASSAALYALAFDDFRRHILESVSWSRNDKERNKKVAVSVESVGYDHTFQPTNHKSMSLMNFLDETVTFRPVPVLKLSFYEPIVNLLDQLFPGITMKIRTKGRLIARVSAYGMLTNAFILLGFFWSSFRGRLQAFFDVFAVLAFCVTWARERKLVVKNELVVDRPAKIMPVERKLLITEEDQFVHVLEPEAEEPQDSAFAATEDIGKDVRNDENNMAVKSLLDRQPLKCLAFVVSKFLGVLVTMFTYTPEKIVGRQFFSWFVHTPKSSTGERFPEFEYSVPELLDLWVEHTSSKIKTLPIKDSSFEDIDPDFMQSFMNSLNSINIFSTKTSPENQDSSPLNPINHPDLINLTPEERLNFYHSIWNSFVSHFLTLANAGHVDPIMQGKYPNICIKFGVLGHLFVCMMHDARICSQRVASSLDRRTFEDLGLYPFREPESKPVDEMPQIDIPIEMKDETSMNFKDCSYPKKNEDAPWNLDWSRLPTASNLNARSRGKYTRDTEAFIVTQILLLLKQIPWESSSENVASVGLHTLLSPLASAGESTIVQAVVVLLFAQEFAEDSSRLKKKENGPLQPSQEVAYPRYFPDFSDLCQGLNVVDPTLSAIIAIAAPLTDLIDIAVRKFWVADLCITSFACTGNFVAADDIICKFYGIHVPLIQLSPLELALHPALAQWKHGPGLQSWCSLLNRSSNQVCRSLIYMVMLIRRWQIQPYSRKSSDKDENDSNEWSTKTPRFCGIIQWRQVQRLINRTILSVTNRACTGRFQDIDRLRHQILSVQLLECPITRGKSTFLFYQVKQVVPHQLDILQNAKIVLSVLIDVIEIILVVFPFTPTPVESDKLPDKIFRPSPFAKTAFLAILHCVVSWFKTVASQLPISQIDALSNVQDFDDFLKGTKNCSDFEHSSLSVFFSSCPSIRRVCIPAVPAVRNHKVVSPGKIHSVVPFKEIPEDLIFHASTRFPKSLASKSGCFVLPSQPSLAALQQLALRMLCQLELVSRCMLMKWNKDLAADFGECYADLKDPRFLRIPDLYALFSKYKFQDLPSTLVSVAGRTRNTMIAETVYNQYLAVLQEMSKVSQSLGASEPRKTNDTTACATFGYKLIAGLAKLGMNLEVCNVYRALQDALPFEGLLNTKLYQPNTGQSSIIQSVELASRSQQLVATRPSLQEAILPYVLKSALSCCDEDLIRHVVFFEFLKPDKDTLRLLALFYGRRASLDEGLAALLAFMTSNCPGPDMEESEHLPDLERPILVLLERFVDLHFSSTAENILNLNRRNFSQMDISLSGPTKFGCLEISEGLYFCKRCVPIVNALKQLPTSPPEDVFRIANFVSVDLLVESCAIFEGLSNISPVTTMNTILAQNALNKDAEFPSSCSDVIFLWKLSDEPNLEKSIQHLYNTLIRLLLSESGDTKIANQANRNFADLLIYAAQFLADRTGNLGIIEQTYSCLGKFGNDIFKKDPDEPQDNYFLENEICANKNIHWDFAFFECE